MITVDPHERFAELAAGHALAALEPADEQVFLAHLASCAACERSLGQHTGTLAHLAYAADPVDLPPSLLAGIRAGMADSTPREDDVPAPASLAAARARRGGSFRVTRGWVGAAAAAAMVLTLGGWITVLRHDSSQYESRSARLAAAVRMIGDGHSRNVPLKDANGNPVAVAVVDGNSVALVVDGLPPNNTATSTYVLWQKGQYGLVAPVGTFDVRGKGVDVIEHLRLATHAVDITGFAITQEKGRRAPSLPGSSPVAGGSVSA